mmetsp:Transcript_104148/g.301289  ORF Transcript_104148/g.301289 Transcript_104148/m.301289 type:complete len:870 (-) Transcript_104148:205-2814(-)
MVSKSSVVGIDLGAADSYVAFVGKGIVDIVQNEVSKRATPSIVGFTDRERLLGDTALALIRSNVKNTCRNFKHLLGRKIDAPDVQIENFWSTSELTECEDGHAGYLVKYKGEERKMSAVEVTAMYLTKLRDITEAWCDGKVTDVVIAVPSSFADVQRQALLDAAKVAGMSVLRLMNEHTATALAYGIYRSNDFDPEKPMTVAFCSMGHSLFSVSVVRFVRGKLTVVCEKSDKVGGRELDECLMREFAAQFEKKHGCNPLSNKKSSFKLEDAVMKTKKVLSANSEAPLTVECLMEDEDLASSITREELEKMCEPARKRVVKVLEDVKAACAAAGVPVNEIDSVEIIGGGSRVPWVKQVCSEAFDGKPLSTTMNQEESVARGCALQAAMLSPLYKVRDFKVEDSTAHSIVVGWWGSAADAEAKGVAEEGDIAMEGGEGQYKTAAIFPAGSAMNVAKMLTFYRKAPFEVKAEYENPASLLPGTPKELGTFRIEMPASETAKKVQVKAKLNLHGIFAVESAQMVEEEEVEEIVKEKREIPAEEKPAEGEAKPAEGEEKKDAEEKADEKAEGSPQSAKSDKKESEGSPKSEKKDGEEKKEPEKKYEWVEVKKMKKRTKKTELQVVASGTPGLSPTALQKLMDAESAMQAEMREIIETDEKKNDLESYILNMRDKISSGGVYGEYISDADRDAFSSELTKAEDWLYDNPDATKLTYIEKLDELKTLGDPVVFRSREAEMRDEWIQAFRGTVANYRSAAVGGDEKYSHIAPEKLASITTACDEAEAWLQDKRQQQEATPKHVKPVLLCVEIEQKNKDLAKMADAILSEPKPAPPKEEKKEEKAEQSPKDQKDEPELKEEEKKAEESPKESGSMDVD